MATYYFKDGATNHFSDATNWYYDSGFGSPANLVPDSNTDTVLIGDDTLSITCYLDINFTVGTGQHLTITGNSTLYIGATGYAAILTSTGTLNVNANANLIIESNGQLVINATSTLTNLGTMNNIGGIVDVSGQFTNYYSFTNQVGGTYTNRGTTYNYSTFNSAGSIACSGSNVFGNVAGSMAFNSGSVTISPSTTFNQAGGTITSYVNLIFPAGALVTISGGSLVNYNIISNYAFLNIASGTLNNQASVLNFSAISLNGTYINNNITVNNGIFSATQNNGFISVRPFSTFTNNNQFIFGSKSNTYFKGDIFPQVPSSAAFGTAILF